VGDFVVFGDLAGTLYGFDTATGTERWRFATHGIVSSPAVVGGVIYAGTLDGRLVAIGGA
jgi:outer membrane protein assembly factor BamB